MELPSGFTPHGTHIHVSSGYGPHLRGEMGGRTCHLDYYGQSTLSMYTKGGHDFNAVNSLHSQHPGVFNNSGIGYPKY